MSFTARDKLRCVQRELALRKQVYPRWVQAGRLSGHQANREIALMEAIVQDYAREAGRLQPNLFESEDQ